ncbi:hypothetical protein NPIL_571431, partial [Nephila pilipes]
GRAGLHRRLAWGRGRAGGRSVARGRDRNVATAFHTKLLVLFLNFVPSFPRRGTGRKAVAKLRRRSKPGGQRGQFRPRSHRLSFVPVRPPTVRKPTDLGGSISTFRIIVHPVLSGPKRPVRRHGLPQVIALFRQRHWAALTWCRPTPPHGRISR